MDPGDGSLESISGCSGVRPADSDSLTVTAAGCRRLSTWAASGVLPRTEISKFHIARCQFTELKIELMIIYLFHYKIVHAVHIKDTHKKLLIDYYIIVIRLL